ISGAATVCVGGTPPTIAAGTVATGGGGAITYQWYKYIASISGVTAISGATATSYTPPTTDAAATGTITYIRQAKSASCPEVTATGGYFLRVISDPTIAISGEQGTICYNTAPTAMAATPTGGVGTVSYQWYSGTSSTAATTSITGATLSTYAPSSLTTTTYYRVVASFTGSGCEATSTVIAKTVYPQFTAGSIITAHGTVTQATNPGLTITNSTLASGGDGNITYQWRRTGLSSATLTGDEDSYAISNDASNYALGGVYYFMRYAHDAMCNVSWVPSSGTYTLNVNPLSVPIGSDSDDIWTCGSQIWSGALRNPAGCVAVSDLGEEPYPTAQYINYSISYGYYYNWSCVNTYANTLCPPPWRVPTQTDFQTLISCTTASTLSSAWGRPGVIHGSSRSDHGVYGVWWGSYGYGGGAPTGQAISYDSSSSLHTVYHYTYLGLPVRCVRDL
ncbi:MAG: fibrobacter succinogenes major paralogous domain-containing protein, partial [Prevotellaceae bacterium]|nr:fibrobacter succinogenes major paralogous domain-containing protein [Prevotellaceae bacterium]